MTLGRIGCRSYVFLRYGVEFFAPKYQFAMIQRR